MKKQKSFTLVELMVVIAIIIVLAAIAIPTYMNMTRRANKASVGSNMGVLATGLATYQTDWGKYPVSLTAVNVAEVTDSFYKEFTGGGEVNNRGASAAYLSPSTLKNLRNPFYPSDPAHGIMYVSDETGTHYCLFAKISNNENATAFKLFGIQDVYATEEPAPAETGSFLYRTDTSSNITSSAWAALTSDPAKYPGAMALTVSINPLGAGTVTLSPSGGVYLVNTPVTLTASSAAGSSFVNWTGGATSTTTTVTMTSNKTVTANFEVATFTLTYTAGEGGTITGTTPQTVNYGTSGTAVTAVPAANYHFVAWSDAFATATRTDTDVVAAKAVTATFALDTHTITASTGSNGTVTPVGVTTCNYGASQAYVITPATGYHTFAITVDGSAVATTSPYTFAAIAAEHTISATFAIDTYTVTFDKNGGDGEASPTAMTVNYNIALGPLPTEPTKPGYNFTGWNTLANGTGTTFAGTTPVIADLTVYAQWTVADQTLTFASNGGSAVTAITQNYGTSVSAPTAPTKTGYTFGAWYNESGLTTGHIFATMGLSTTLYAKWTADSQTLTFASNGGTSVTAITQAFGTAVGAPTVPTKAGYTFVNWYNESGLLNIHTFDAMGLSTTVYAKWTTNNYIVTFNGNGGIPSPTSKQVTYASTYGTLATVTLTGYTFNGWFTATTGGTQVTAATTVTITADQTLYAQWTIISYTVIFNNKGGAQLSTQSVNYGDTATAPGNPTYTGWTFTGWDRGLTNITAATTITANYNINYYTVTFVDWNSTVLSTQSIACGGNASAPGNPTRTGYAFAGWSGTYTGVTSARTITATYYFNTLQIFVVGGGGKGGAGGQYTRLGGSGGGGGRTLTSDVSVSNNDSWAVTVGASEQNSSFVKGAASYIGSKGDTAVFQQVGGNGGSGGGGYSRAGNGARGAGIGGTNGGNGGAGGTTGGVGQGSTTTAFGEGIGTKYGGGGGGGGAFAIYNGDTYVMPPAAGGADGGGGGGVYGTWAGASGSPNTGGGGGGGGGNPAQAPGGVGGYGGSGIVIVRYITANFEVCTGGTKTTNGIYTVHTFTSSGTFTLLTKIQ